jgi:hypothetical protein
MNKYNKFFIIENLDIVRRIRIGRFGGVDLLVTRITWLGPFVFFGFHFLVNLINVNISMNERLSQSLIFAFAVEVTTAIHALGHIASGKLVGSVMDELLITAVRDVNIYHGDQTQFPAKVHLGRALGGPTLNLIVVAVFMLAGPSIPAGFWSNLNTSLISVNLFFGVGSFLPLRSVDGEVIWREVRSLLKK